MTIQRIVSTFVVSLSLALVAPAASGEPGIGSLVQQLTHAGDFRLRVQAALQLGKSRDTRATRPLAKALDDKDVSVRAAAAAALKTLGDPEALPALRENRLDRSPIVRRQVKESIDALETRMKAVRVLVQVGSMKNRTPRPEQSLALALDQASRKTLQSIDALNVVGEAERTMELSKLRNLPAVMMTGSVRELGAEASGSSVTYTAKVEYVLHRMPGQSIAGKVSGRASARASAAELKDRRRHAKLREQVLFAAVESALRRAQPAILQVAQL